MLGQVNNVSGEKCVLGQVNNVSGEKIGLLT